MANVMKMAWTIYNNEKRTGQKFNRARFGHCLKVAHAEIARRAAFRNAMFAPLPMPFGWDVAQWTAPVWDNDNRRWVEVSYERKQA